MNCPVCGAPDGVCKGDDIEVKESGFMFNQQTEPMRLPRQYTRRGRAGYVGEEDGKVQTFDRPVRSENGGTIPVDLQRRLDAMDDEALAGLGLQRVKVQTQTEDDGEKKKRKVAPANKRRKTATLRTKSEE